MEELLNLGINDITFVVKYRSAEIEDFIRKNYSGEFRFVDQIGLGGTGAAILSARDHVSDEFMMLYGDNVFSPGTVRALFEAPGDGAVGVMRSPEPERYGCVELNAHGNVRRIVEKPKAPDSNLVVVGGYRFPPDIMQYLSTIAPSARGELETPDAVNLSIEAGSTYSCSSMEGTIDIATVEDIARYEAALCPEVQSRSTG